jgi:predicted ester cyclase
VTPEDSVTPKGSVTPEDVVSAQFAALESGDATLAATCIHPAHVNHMAADEPPACARPGVPGFMATSAWLHIAFSDLRFELIEMATEGDRSIAHMWMRGTQTGPFTVFPPGGKPVAFPPTGREFAVRQCHVIRFRDGLSAEHIAVRDDLGMMTQLGHLPPTPAAWARMARFQIGGGAKRAIAHAIEEAGRAAAAAQPAGAGEASAVAAPQAS